MDARQRLTVLVLAASAIICGVLASPTSQDQGGANAESWSENFLKWHQGPLLTLVAVAVAIAILVPLRARGGRIIARSCAVVVLGCGFVKAPWILGALMYRAFNSGAGLAALCAVLLWATSVAILVGVANRSPISQS